ncbi:PilZ domain-containing protein [Novosphingobium bradum]|uniref:PilZ domain-containing protein n=1 Tax=Novosphingobium bradum TaxID=1737444 RepID=A0ABV7IP12_9SPHN
MGAGAQLSVTDLRRSTRHPVNFRVIGEHRQLGDVHLHIVNLSAHGFMAQAGEGSDGLFGLGRGERLVIRLPHVGRIEAHLIWTTEDRAGFQFERIIRANEFSALIDALQPNPRLRARR